MWELTINIETDGDFSYEDIEDNIESELFFTYDKAFYRMKDRLEYIIKNLDVKQNHVAEKYKLKLEELLNNIISDYGQCCDMEYDIFEDFEIGNWYFDIKISKIKTRNTKDMIQILYK